MKSDILDLDVQVHAKTDRGLMVSADGDKEKAVWLPLSQIEVDMRGNGVAVIAIPEWLALEKGLI